MNTKTKVLLASILAYLPVTIDITVLHVAIPSLTLSLGATGTELLWIIDAYPLIMTGMLLPMGVLGDRIGVRKLVIAGTGIFGLASLAAALSTTPVALIASRAALAVGAAMILPASLASLRVTFTDATERAKAVGWWSAVSSVGACAGPLLGGFLLRYFYWGSVFIINIPVSILVILIAVRHVPLTPVRKEQPWPIAQAVMLIAALLLLVYALKSLLRADDALLVNLGATVAGFMLLAVFVRLQLKSSAPMLDIRLLQKRAISVGVIMAISAMIALVGYELLLTQEMQFVAGKTPLAAGAFMLPLTVSAALAAPFAGWLSARLGMRILATCGMALSAVSFFGLAGLSPAEQPWLAWGCMVLLGISVSAALVASTAAIMSAAPPEKAGTASSIEGMAYELGAGLGVAFFGLLLGIFYSSGIVLPALLDPALAEQARSSIAEAMQVVLQLQQQGQAELALGVSQAGKAAFSGAHGYVLAFSGLVMAVLSGVVWWALRSARNADSRARDGKTGTSE